MTTETFSSTAATKFEVGDTVLYKGWNGRAITKVTKINGNGYIRIACDGEALFNPKGKYEKNVRNNFNKAFYGTIKKITPEEEAELRQDFARNKKIKECRKTMEKIVDDNRLRLSYEASVKILEIIKEDKVFENAKEKEVNEE